MKLFISQKDEICSECECELPKGSRIFIGDKVLCEDCAEEEEKNYIGDIYG